MKTFAPASDERDLLDRARLAETGPSEITLPTVLFYLTAFVVVAMTSFIVNRRFLYPLTDGLLWEVLQAYRPHYGSRLSVLNSDPLQGMFDIFPQAYRGTLLLDTLSSLPFDVRVVGALIHGAYAAFAAVSTYAMARTAGIARRPALLAAILVPVLTLPGLLGTTDVVMPGLLGTTGMVTHMFALAPNYSYIISGMVLAIALFWAVDGRLNANFVFGGMLAFLIVAEACNAFVLHMTLLLPMVIAFGAGGLLVSESKRELKVKLGWAVTIAGGLVLLGMPAYLYALGSNTAFRFFYNELNDFALRQIPSNISLKNDLFYVLQWRSNQGGIIGAIVSALGLITATYFAWSGEARRLRIFARCFLSLILCMGLICFVCHFWFYFTGYDFYGPNPYHMVYALWPFHIIFVARLIEGASVSLVRLASSRWRSSRDTSKLASHGVIIAALLLPVCGVAVLKDRSYLDLTIKPNAITDYLSARNAAIVGAPYRGAVASFIGTHNRKNVSRTDLYQYVWFEQLAFNHNDFAAYGLWTYHIPTLNQFSVTMSPQYYLMLSELLARPSDRQDRSFIIITAPNEAILKLWGARFVIADYALPFGTERLSMPVEVMLEWYPKQYPKLYRGINFDSPIRLFELDEANLGNYSPTSIRHVSTAKEVVDHMREDGFDGARTVIVTEGMGGEFVPATQALMTVERGGVSIAASSRGESLLVLPLQYSHCWQLDGAPNAKLFRANLMQLGIRFSGALKADLRQSFGPLWHSHCRILDSRDMERLEIGRARSE